jgi:twitching motility protein PilT
MIFELLKQCSDRGASDLHFKVGYPPFLRIDGNMVPLNLPEIRDEDYENMLESVLDDFHLIKFNTHQKLDFGFSHAGTRFRVNLFNDYLGGSAVFRMIPFVSLTFDDIDLPKSARGMADRLFGLILVTGATGAGKSTTLSCFINHINANRAKSVITLEDPIEYIFEDQRSLINQRQIGVDCLSYEEGIRLAVQTDADVIMVGELRTRETALTALAAAESGKLVLATLHSSTSTQALERFVNMFPENTQDRIFNRLGTSLVGIVSQTLLPRKSGKGRVAAFEILMGTPIIRGLISERRIHMIPSYLESGSETGMCTLDQSLARLTVTEKVHYDEALRRASNPGQLKKILEQG